MEMRDYFETVTCKQFVGSSLERKENGDYCNPDLEDHWQTFQEGWECAMTYRVEHSNKKDYGSLHEYKIQQISYE